jgi:hypothetical protein
MIDFIGNRRFLFLEQKISELDISKAVSKIDPLIIDSAKLDFDSSDIILEFRDNPRVDDFKEKTVLIGRLITGYEQSAFEQASYRDYAEKQIHEFVIAPSEDWDKFFTAILLVVPKEIVAWKLRIDDSVTKLKVQF